MNKTLIFGHKSPDTDTIMSSLVMANLERKLGNEDVVACRLGDINKETQYALNYFKVDAPELIENVEDGTSVILVDHNEFAQSVNGIENAKIKKVVDHHRISNFETSEPLFYMAEPVGCTSTILYGLYVSNKVEISSTIAGLMLSAIISDTLLLKSPTTTEKDKKALEELAKIANIDVNVYGLDMLKAGTDLSDYSSEELINLDAKNINMNGNNVVIAQVNTVSIEDVVKKKEDLENAINKKIQDNNLDLFMLAITDILNSNSQAIALGKRTDMVEKAYNVKLEDNTSSIAFAQKLKDGDIVVNAHDYENFEKVGNLGFTLPTNDKNITTESGDLILYQGNQITLYYDTNSWSFTKLGKVQNVSQNELKDILGSGDVVLTFSLRK